MIEDTQLEIDHLDSIATALDIAETEADLQQIKEEMMESGYIKHKYSKKKTQGKSKPYHYRSTDGFDIYVGKNNFQNDELTFKFAEGNDWWFHAKGMPGFSCACEKQKQVKCRIARLKKPDVWLLFIPKDVVMKK